VWTRNGRPETSGSDEALARVITLVIALFCLPVLSTCAPSLVIPLQRSMRPHRQLRRGRRRPGGCSHLVGQRRVRNRVISSDYCPSEGRGDSPLVSCLLPNEELPRLCCPPAFIIPRENGLARQAAGNEGTRLPVYPLPQPLLLFRRQLREADGGQVCTLVYFAFCAHSHEGESIRSTAGASTRPRCTRGKPR
jgi:hypothetical protein